ncbi:MAG: ArgK protein [Deltaproteobacteria bacterium]|nr:ArgK protein [Deltaproteobacteria bacterium]MCB9785951.1 ArgK protein [Deltaproteobacteria bacterium]
MSATLAAEVRAGSRSALARLLNQLESSRPDDRAAASAVIDELAIYLRPGGLLVGLTGPPGVGKSTLAGALVASWRQRALSVGVIAVDPSSRRSGGALLGDRARIGPRGGDDGLFVRSMAARDRLGGLAPATFEAVIAMGAAADRVLVETVGVGQSETDVSEAVDLTVVVIQPASGDTLQFIKAGLMEVPDVVVVGKADLGAAARRTARELRAVMPALGRPDTPVLEVSALAGDGVGALCDVLEELREAGAPELGPRRDRRLREQVLRTFRDRYGSRGLDALGGAAGARARLDALPPGTPPSALLAALTRAAGH